MMICPTCREKFTGSETTCPECGVQLVTPEEAARKSPVLQRGATVGEYVVEELLGEGGFGSVYSASHPIIGKAAAIKVLHPHYSANPHMVARFVAEARAVNKIRHPNIVDIFAFGQLDDGRRYYVMELLEGLPLDRYLRSSGPVPPALAIPLLRGIAHALDAAHAAGIVHRDLKPENLFIAFRDRARASAKLLDFGIAKLLGEPVPNEVKTSTGTPLGTPQYMSPEQCRNRPVDHRTDIYSFGILMHRVLTGRLPFEGGDPLEMLNAQASTPAPPASSVLPSLPPELDAPLLHMLEKDPDDRPTSVLAALDNLAAAARSAGIDIPMESADVDATLVAAVIGDSLRPGARREQANGPSIPPRASITPGKERRAQHTPADGKSSAPNVHAVSIAPAAVKGTPRMGFLAALLALGALGAGAAAVYFQRTSPAPLPASAVVVPSVPSSGAVAPAPVSTAAPSTSTVEPAEVVITVASAPPGTKVFLADHAIGSVPGAVHLKRGSEAVTLRFVADGYAPLEMRVLPDRDSSFPVSMTPRAGRPGSPRGSKDLEPF